MSRYSKSNRIKRGNVCFDHLFDVLEHIEHTSRVLKEINNMMYENTYLLISVPVENIPLKIGRYLTTRIKDFTEIPHWNGEFQSEQEFECLLSSKFEIMWRRGFPFRIAPNLSSYDTFFLFLKKERSNVLVKFLKLTQ